MISEHLINAIRSILTICQRFDSRHINEQTSLPACLTVPVFIENFRHFSGLSRAVFHYGDHCSAIWRGAVGPNPASIRASSARLFGLARQAWMDTD